MTSVAMPDVGIFFGRPDRSHFLAEQLRARGLTVVFYNDVGRAGSHVPVPLAFAPALRRILSTNHQAYLTSASFTPALCLCLNRLLRGRPYVFNAVGVASAMFQERARRWPWPKVAERLIYPTLMRGVLTGASYIVCNSRYLERTLRSQFPRHAEKMTTIYNGIDFDRFTTQRRDRHPAATARSVTLLSVMTWNYPAKASGARLLIDAMETIAARHPDARLTIAAKTINERYPRAVEAYLATKRWKDRISIVYNHPRVEDLLANADVFVYATPVDSNDSLPRAVLEAQAAGVPAVTTDTAGCSEVVRDGVTGFTVPYESEALARRALDLLASADLRQEFGRQAHQHVRQTFSWEQMAESYARLFLQIVRR